MYSASAPHLGQTNLEFLNKNLSLIESFANGDYHNNAHASYTFISINRLLSSLLNRV